MENKFEITGTTNQNVPIVKRGRGRPRKVVQPVAKEGETTNEQEKKNEEKN